MVKIKELKGFKTVNTMMKSFTGDKNLKKLKSKNFKSATPPMVVMLII